MMIRNILYIIKQDLVSQKAQEILESSNITFQSITIEINGFGKFMWRDTRTCEIPSLLTPTKVYCGLEEISKYAHFTHNQ